MLRFQACRYLIERSGAAENREEGSTNSSRSGVRLAEAKFSLEWENRSDTCVFADDLNSGWVFFQKLLADSQKHSNLHYRACATEYDSARQALEEAIEAPSKDLFAIVSAKRESAIEPANSRTVGTARTTA